MSGLIPLRCEKCGGLLQADPAQIETGGVLSCSYCGADFTIPLPKGGFETKWFETKFGIELNPLQKIAITWLKQTGRIDCFAGGYWLRLADEEITDRDCGYLGSLSFLRELDLRNNDITDAGAAELSRLGSLITLELGNNNLTDEALPHIGELSHLTILDLEGADLNDEGLEKLYPLQKLEELNIMSTLVTERGVLALVENIPSLSKLRVETAGLFLRPLLLAGVLPLIENVELMLDVSNQNISDDDLKHVAELKNLFSLNLNDNDICGEGLLYLKDLELSHLNLNNTPIGDSGIEYILELKKLEFLKIWGTNITDKGARKLRRKRIGLQVDHPVSY